MGSKLLHADRQTDTMKLIVAFRNFANATKNATFRSASPDYGRYLCRITLNCRGEKHSPAANFPFLLWIRFMNYRFLRTTKLFSHFMKAEGSLQHSQELATCPYPEPDRSTACPPYHFSNIHFNTIPPSMSGSSKWSSKATRAQAHALALAPRTTHTHARTHTHKYVIFISFPRQ